MKKKYKTNNLLINIFLLFLSLTLFYLANPNNFFINGLGFLAWFYYLPVLLLVRRLELKKVWIYGFFLGSLFYLSYAYWLYNYGPICLIFICIFEGLVYSIFIVLLKYCTKISCKYSFILCAFFITSFELLKTKGFLGFNYTITSYTQFNYVHLIQICDIFGALTFNFFIIFSSCILYSFFDKSLSKKEYFYIIHENSQILKNKTNFEVMKIHEKKIKSFSYVQSFLFLLIFIFIISTFIFYSNGKIKKIDSLNKNLSTIKICAVQHNEDPKENTLLADINNFNTLKQVTNTITEFNNDIQIILWPETAIVTNINNNYFLPKSDKKISKSQEFIFSVMNYFNKNDYLFVFGNNGIELNQDNQKKLSNNVIVYQGGKNNTPKDFQIYKKHKLVPFTESFPYSKKLPTIANKVEKLYGPSYTSGDDFTVFNYNNFYFSTPICFEDTFSDVCRNMYKNGSRAFLNLSNDSWSKSRVCQRQHLSMAIFRSIENRIPSVRSTSSGITCYINQYGAIKQNAQEFTKSYIVVDVPIISQSQKQTFYCEYGFYLENAILIITSFLLIIKGIFDIINLYKLKGTFNGKKRS